MRPARGFCRRAVDSHPDRAPGVGHAVEPPIARAGRSEQHGCGLPAQIAQQSQEFPEGLLARFGRADQVDLVQVGDQGRPQDIAKIAPQVEPHPSPSVNISVPKRFHFLHLRARQKRRPRRRCRNEEAVGHLDRHKAFVASRHRRGRPSPPAVPRSLRIIPVQIEENAPPMGLLGLLDQPAQSGITGYPAIEARQGPRDSHRRRHLAIAVHPGIQLGLVEIADPHLHRRWHLGPGGGVFVRYPHDTFAAAHRVQEGLRSGQSRQIASHQNGLSRAQPVEEPLPICHHLDRLARLTRSHIGVHPLMSAGHHHRHPPTPKIITRPRCLFSA